MRRAEEIAGIIDSGMSYAEIKKVAKATLGLNKPPSNATVSAARKLLVGEVPVLKNKSPEQKLMELTRTLVQYMRDNGITEMTISDTGDVSLYKHELLTVKP